MKIKCECSREITAQRDAKVYTRNHEFITWYCPYCGRSGTKLTKYGRHGPMVIFNQRERVAPVADEPCRHRIPIFEYGGERISVPFVCTYAKQQDLQRAPRICGTITEPVADVLAGRSHIKAFRHTEHKEY